MILFALILVGLVVFVALDSTENETDSSLALVKISTSTRASGAPDMPRT